MFFFFKQKTAYEMRISDWSSDVRSSISHRFPAPRSIPGQYDGQAEHMRFCAGDAAILDPHPSGLGLESMLVLLAEPIVGTGRGHRAMTYRNAALVKSFDHVAGGKKPPDGVCRSEEHTSELKSLMRTST